MLSRIRRAARLAAIAAAGAAAALPPAARAQTVTPRCSAVAAGACTALRLDLAAAADAPLAVRRVDVQLAGGYRFALLAGGATAAFRGEDAFSFGAAFTGTAEVRGGRALFADLLASPGFTFELGPAEAGYLEFALAGGVGPLDVSYALRDPDGAAAGDGAARVDVPAAAVVPEPATLALVAAGAAALAAGARRRAARPAA